MILRSKDYRLAERCGLDTNVVNQLALKALKSGRTFRQQLRVYQRHQDGWQCYRAGHKTSYQLRSRQVRRLDGTLFTRQYYRSKRKCLRFY